MASFTNYKIDFTPQKTTHFWRVELVAWLIKRNDPGLQGEELEEIAIASNDVVRAEFSLALTCPQVEEIRKCRTIAKTWTRLEEIFGYYGPVSEAPLFRQVAHQFLDGRPEMKEMLREFLEEIEEDEDIDPSCPTPLTVLRNLITNPDIFSSRKKITATLDHLGLLGGVQKLCGCNPYVPAHEIPEAHRSPINCLYCKYDVPVKKASQDGNRSDEVKSTRDRGTVRKPARSYYETSTSESGKPYLKTEIHSMLKFTSTEHHIIFRRDEATVVSNAGDVKLRATRAGARYFKMELDGVKTQPPDYADLATWHRRLGHIDFRDLQRGYRQFAFRGLKLIHPSKNDSPSCRICQTIKLPGFPLRPVPTVETQILDIIHTDFCGPIPGQSKGTSIFFITFTDDASGWMSMYFIRHCTEVLKYFKEYVTQAEALFKRKIRTLQTTDCLDQSFNEYLKAKGIERLNIPTDTRYIRALLETAKCMLMQSGLDDSLYCEALNTACFIRNRSSSARLDGLTPYQKWYGRPPSMRHMHEFGAKVTCTANKDPDKEKAETKEGQYLGFAKNKKAYRIWIPDYQQVVLSDEVDFQDYLNAKNDRAWIERQRPHAAGRGPRPGTSRESGAAKTSAAARSSSTTRPVIPRRRKTRTKYSRYDSKPPKYDKDIRDNVPGRCQSDDSSGEDSDSDLDRADTIYEEEEFDTTQKGNDSDEDAERRIVTSKPVTDCTRKQSASAGPSVGGAGPGAIPRNAQETRSPSIPSAQARPRDN